MFSDEATVDVGRADLELAAPPPAWLQALRKLYESPAVFGVVFVLGFLVTFAPGAMIVLDQPSLPELYAAGQDDVVVTELRRRRKDAQMKPEDWVLLGNALSRRYGGVVRDEVLDVYMVAAHNNRVDPVALDNTLKALGDEKHQKKAIEVIAAWPAHEDPSKDPTRILGGHMNDETFFQRHGALEALKARKPSAEVQALADATVAWADLTSWTCANDATPGGMKALAALVESDARDALKKVVPVDLPATNWSTQLARVSACVKEREFRTLQNSLATFVK